MSFTGDWRLTDDTSRSFLESIEEFDVDYLIPAICPPSQDVQQHHAHPRTHQVFTDTPSSHTEQPAEQQVDYSAVPSCRFQSEIEVRVEPDDLVEERGLPACAGTEISGVGQSEAALEEDFEHADLVEAERLLAEADTTQSQCALEVEFEHDDLLEAERLLAEADKETSDVIQSPGSQPSVADSGFFSSADNDTSESKTDQSACSEDTPTDNQPEVKDKSPEGIPEEKNTSQAMKPEDSYMALIAHAILASSTGRLLLCDIYQHVMDTNPYYRTAKCAWRNSIRHNLSVNECFIKAGRARNGRGFYWAIHPACASLFRQGEFSRRLARTAVQRSQRITAGSSTAPGHGVSGNDGLPFQALQPLAQVTSPEEQQVYSFSPYAQRQQDCLKYQPMSSTPIRGHGYHPYSRITPVPANPSHVMIPQGQAVYYNNFTMSCAGAEQVLH